MRARGKAVTALGPFLLALCVSGSAWAAASAGYETRPLPPGRMVLDLPIDPIFNQTYLAVTVTVGPGLRLGRFEVSLAEWKACVRAGACDSAHGEAGAPGHPVTRVDWQDAADYAAWLSRRTGRRFRLPTEGEWWYAFSLGKDLRIQERTFNYADLEEVRRIPKRTWPRGKFGENAWGFADLLGNVWEWTLSCYTLSQARLLAAPDLARLASADACSTRIVAGESRAHVPDFIRDTYNGGCATVEPAANLGFRLIEETAP